MVVVCGCEIYNNRVNYAEIYNNWINLPEIYNIGLLLYNSASLTQTSVRIFSESFFWEFSGNPVMGPN